MFLLNFLYFWKRITSEQKGITISLVIDCTNLVYHASMKKTIFSCWMWLLFVDGNIFPECMSVVGTLLVGIVELKCAKKSINFVYTWRNVNVVVVVSFLLCYVYGDTYRNSIKELPPGVNVRKHKGNIYPISKSLNKNVY